MRLWSIHPGYLDAKGLVALWREALLAQKVLQNRTRGYKTHPQLTRFKKTANPVGAIAEFLRYVVDEADSRGYNFDRSKIAEEEYQAKIPVTSGQLAYEITHLLGKLKVRTPELYVQLKEVKKINHHPMFKEVSGEVEDWEVV